MGGQIAGDGCFEAGLVAGGRAASGVQLPADEVVFVPTPQVRVTEINELYQQPDVLQRNPFLRDSLLIGQDGERVIDRTREQPSR